MRRFPSGIAVCKDHVKRFTNSPYLADEALSAFRDFAQNEALLTHSRLTEAHGLEELTPYNATEHLELSLFEIVAIANPRARFASCS